MTRSVPVLIVAACLTVSPQSQRPEFKVTPEVPAMPKALMKLPRTPITRAKFPTVDFHFHGGQLKTADDYRKIVKQMDDIGVGVLCNMDGGFGADFDRNMKVSEPFKDRVIQFARLDFAGINQPGWSAKTAAELERDFLAGAVGLKINKVLGLDLKNTDGTYIQADDTRFDPIWEMAAKHNKPVMIHIGDSYGRFLPIGPENERYEAGLWRSSPEGNYYQTGHPTPDVIEKAREHMHAKHPKTRFVNAHVAMLYYDMDKVEAFLDKYPNADVEISATVQDLGRAPLMIRRFFLKYQDRILFGSDGNPGRGNAEFWEPHWRFLETYDEHFDHPAQLRSATGAPLHGRWRISGIGLPDEVLRKVYYANALRYLPAARASIEKQLAAHPSAAALPIASDRLLNADAEPGNWLTYSGDYRGHHYSGLDQITTGNVHLLKAKWVYQMHRQKIETTPIVVDGVMYVTRPQSDVIALDAETGRALWTYEHRVSSRVYTCCGEVNRGVAILGGTLFLTTLDAQLVALDARSGRVLWKKPIADPAMNYTATGAPLAVKGKVIVGIAGAEGGIRGFLDAYDANTGDRVWRFWTVPSPGEPGSDTWGGDSWKNGGASTWLTGSYDPELNLLYWGTGNPGPDYNGDVRPGDNLYSSSLLALDLDTGRLKWHFQFTPHDTRDYDGTQIPVLIDSAEGRKLVVVPSRNGFYYVLDRRTGDLLLAKPFVKVTWAKEIDRRGRPVVNPGQEPTTDGNDGIWPGVDGGHNWMSPSYHPGTKLLYFNAREERRRFFKTDAPEFRPGEAFFGGGGGGGARFRPEESWGKLVAMAPETGEIKWEHRILAPPWAGVLSTAGNLVFSATPAGNVYALDARTGSELWHFNGGGPVYASPITFLSRGRQIVALSIGDNLVAFGVD